jgi:hypothetical protein
MSGCATLPYQVEQRQFREALSSGQYEEAKARIDASLRLVPEDKKTGLTAYFTKSLFRQSWRAYKARDWDTSFDLMTTACQKATVALRESWKKECERIAHEYASAHIAQAGIALKRKDLKTAIAQYEAAAKANNDLGRDARPCAVKYAKQRRDLEVKLATAKSQIENEQWNLGAATIQQVQSQDVSLRGQCDELSRLLTERHYEASLRDGREFLTKKQLRAAFAKANEALALDTDHTSAAQLKAQIQQAFSESVREQQKTALENDARSVLAMLAKQYDEFEIASNASGIRTILVNRTDADRNLALAQQHIAEERHEAALDPLHKACSLWPQNQHFADQYRATRVHVGKDAIADAGKADKAHCPLVCALYCLKACHVCPAETKVQDHAQTLLAAITAKIDRQAMKTAFIVDVAVKREIETALDAARLQRAIIGALPPPSRFVFVTGGEKEQASPASTFRITTEVQALTATTQAQAFNKNVRYVAYVAQDPNPRYADLQVQLNAAQIEMTAAQNSYQAAFRAQQAAKATRRRANALGGWARTLNTAANVGGSVGMAAATSRMATANRDYARIAAAMRTTPATVPRNVYANHSYVQHQYQRRGTLRAVVRMLDAENRVIAERVITDNFHASDTAHDGYAAAGLSVDTLDLPSEDDLRARFIKKLYSESAQTAQDYVENHWQKVHAKASTIKAPELRWEKLLTLALQMPSMANEATREIRESLKNIPVDFVTRIDRQIDGNQEGRQGRMEML